MKEPLLRVGGWWIDRTTNEIGRGQEALHLEPKVMEVLVALTDHAGAVLSREELLAAVWPGVVVGDEVLTQSIIKLRKALGDNPRSPAFIETIPKRGYRLIAPVGAGEANPGRRDKRAFAIVASTLSIAAIVVGAYIVQPKPVLPPSGHRGTHSTEAYEDFLRARALFLARSPEANEQARAYYTEALDHDPQFARAYAGLAMTYAMDYRYRQPVAGSPGALDRARELAETARQIDPGNPEIYWATGFIDAQARRHGEALDALNKAIALDPSYADAYALMGGIYTYVGQPARSIPLLRTALRFNPNGGYLYFLLLGRAYLFENDFDQALFNLREAARRNPEDLETHIYLAATLAATGDLGAAQSEADEVRVEDARFSMRGWLETYPMTSPREIERLLRLAAQARL